MNATCKCCIALHESIHTRHTRLVISQVKYALFFYQTRNIFKKDIWRSERRHTSGLIPPVKYFYRAFQGGASFVEHLCYSCFVLVSWSISELKVRFARCETSFSPPVKCFYWPFEGGTSFVDHVFFVSCVSHVFASVLCCLLVTCW